VTVLGHETVGHRHVAEALAGDAAPDRGERIIGGESIAGRQLLTAVDVVGGAGEGRVRHDVHRQRGDVLGADHPADRQRRAQLVTALAVSNPMPELPPMITTVCPNRAGLRTAVELSVLVVMTPPGSERWWW
jgi:hypothetical protein